MGPAQDKESDMMDKRGLICEIENALGSEGSRDLAERVYDELRRLDLISYDSLYGLVVADGVDLMKIVEDLDSADVAQA